MFRSCIVLVISVLAACDTHVPATFPTAAQHPEGERQPDGIAVDLTSEPPAATIEARSEDKVVTLQTPLSIDVAMATVRAFFLSMEAEDIGEMAKVVESGALLHDLSVGAARPIHNVTALWRQRFGTHDFQQLSTRLLYREGDITVFRGPQLEVLPVAVRYLSPSVAAEPTDVVLRVPVVTHTIDSRRVLGDEVFFWLRRTDDTFTIYRMAEDVPL